VRQLLASVKRLYVGAGYIKSARVQTNEELKRSVPLSEDRKLFNLLQLWTGSRNFWRMVRATVYRLMGDDLYVRFSDLNPEKQCGSKALRLLDELVYTRAKEGEILKGLKARLARRSGGSYIEIDQSAHIQNLNEAIRITNERRASLRK